MSFATLLLTSSLALSAPLSQEDPDVQAQREAAFAELLSGCKLVGSFTLDSDETTQLHEDSYTLTRVSKMEDGRWKFEAQVEYGEKAIPIALPMPVEWAGDTPVISVTDMMFPMMGKYSARVLFYGDQYVGVWSGSGYGGHMFGKVVPLDGEGDGGASEGAGGAAGGKAKQKSDEPTDEGASKKDGKAGDVRDASFHGASDDTGSTGGNAALSSEAALATLADSGNWPQFRGPQASGVADGHPTVESFDLETGENVKWRVEVPGLAHSSPVIWGDKLFVTTAIRADGEQELRVGLYGDIAPVQDESEFAFELYCYDKNTGEQLWSQTSWTGVPAIKRHTKGSHAASTPATDGERVVAFFGSEGLYCYDMDGELQWEKSFGVLDSGYYVVPDAQWGFASSPVLHDGVVIVQCDVQEGSFVAALDAKTGDELWRTAREEVPTWSTPTVVVTEDRAQVICNGYKHIGGYDLSTGAELWKLEGGGDIPVPTPVVGDGKVFITNSHGSMQPIYAIDLAAKGTLVMDPEKCEAMVWSDPRRGIYMQTPIVYGEELYLCSDAGILGCYDVATGEELFRERVSNGRSGYTGSGVAADGKLYFTSEEGEVVVVLAGFFDILSRNDLGEECMSSPAVSEGVLYFRTREHLVAIGE